MSWTAMLESYKAKSPVIVFEWNDEYTDARGWVVINSLRGGAAGGGTRMRKGLTKEEVISLAKVMEIKFSVCGPAIGGAKSGIDFDPNDPRKDEVLERWYAAIIPLLKTYYGTGGDLNVDELKDVIPMTEDLGLWHPQEGVVNGHFQPKEGAKVNIVGQLRYGCSKIVEDPKYVPTDKGKKFAVADMITGFGVAKSIEHYYDIFRKSDLKGKRVLIQGWGNVASAAACYMAQMGAKITGIIDIAGAIIRPEGMELNEIKELFYKKNGNKLIAEGMMSFEEANEKIWSVGAEVFIPGAASKIVTQAQVDTMIKNGLEVISCGANVPFIDDQVFFGPTAKYTDGKVSLIPDFIANCGMARVFAFLMEEEIEMTDEAIFSDTSSVIYNALAEVYKKSPALTNIAGKAMEISLSKLT